MKKIAYFWNEIKDKKIKCSLCAHNCNINVGKVGICGVRKNENGTLYTLIYGSTSSLASDPIEKKPLYHFYPGTYAFSMGTIGCNFKCSHCQNFSISTAKTDFPYLKEITPEQVVALAKQHNCQGVSYTYNEPTIWHEFAFDSAKLVKKEGLYTCYVTNGYINEDPLRELSKFLDAMNIDVKSFNENFYKNICKSRLEPVLNTCKLAKELGIHIELTYLVIPGYNDEIEDIRNFCRWIVEKLDDNTPVHFSRFHPDYNMTDVKVTTMESLLKIFEVAKEEGILFPYLGNVYHAEYENTYCPKCGSISIERNNYSISLEGLNESKCSKCGNTLPIITKNYIK
jgi:pyruvate formate lyase activating enzyme